MGEAPNLRNFFIAAGFNSLESSPGAGGTCDVALDRRGAPPMDVWSVDVRRMQPWQNNLRYLRDAPSKALASATRTIGRFASGRLPGREEERSARSPGGGRGVLRRVAGWERPNWYAAPGQALRYEYAWGRQNWFGNNAEEHRAVREGVGMFEQSSFAKLLVQGLDAEAC